MTTKGEVMKKYGFSYISHIKPWEEADEAFEEFIKTLAEKFDAICEDDET